MPKNETVYVALHVDPPPPEPEDADLVPAPLHIRIVAGLLVFGCWAFGVPVARAARAVAGLSRRP